RLQAFFAGTTNYDRTSLLKGDEAKRYQEQYAQWDEKARTLRAEMRELLDAVWADTTKDSIGMFPEEAQEAVFTPAAQRTPMQWQMYYRSAGRIPKDAALEKNLKGDARTRYAALKKQLAEFDSLKPADPPMAETMQDQAREAPPTHILS